METVGTKVRAVSLLIVEDDHAAGEIIRRMLALSFPEATVYSADDGVSGAELYKMHRPDIVITDISMSGQNGVEMAREIVSLAAATRFIVITAHDDPVFREEFEEIGFHAYLLKPLDANKLIVAIEECLAELKRER